VPPSSRLECVGLEIDLVTEGSYKDGGRETQGKGVKNGIRS
jgi:hypothetical protein